jgi:hypothetical protein
VPLVAEPGAFEADMSVEKFKRNKSPGNNQIPSELIKASDSTIRSEIQKLISSFGNSEGLSQRWKGLITVPTYNKGVRTDCSNYQGISLL